MYMYNYQSVRFCSDFVFCFIVFYNGNVMYVILISGEDCLVENFDVSWSH